MTAEPRASKRRTGLLVLAGVAAVVVGAAAPLVLVLRQDTRGYRAASEAMAPTIDLEEGFTVNRDAYGSGDPRVGDIVVFHPPAGAVSASGEQCGVELTGNVLCARPTSRLADDVTFVKRVVGLPGDDLRVVHGRVIRNGERLDEPYAQECLGGDTCTFRGSIEIPADHFFLMGDNRGASDDSRFWGPVPRRALVGRVDDCTFMSLKCTARR